MYANAYNTNKDEIKNPRGGSSPYHEGRAIQQPPLQPPPPLYTKISEAQGEERDNNKG